MQTEMFSRIQTIEGVDCLVVILRKDMPEKRLLLIWSVIIPNRSAATPDEAQCSRWVDAMFGTEEQIDHVNKLITFLKKTQVENYQHVAKPGTLVSTIINDFELTARKA